MAEQVVEDCADVGERLTGACARGHDEVAITGTKLDGVYLVLVKRVALEDVANSRVKNSFGSDFIDGTCRFIGWVELKKRFRPQAALGKLALDG